MIKVSAGILIKDNKVLIAKRKKGKHLAGYWEFPGGKIEANETPEQSLVREFKEEFDVKIEIHSEFHENQYQYPEKTILLKSYLARHVNGDFKLNDHDEINWVKISELKNYQIAEADHQIVRKLENQQNISRSYYSKEISGFLKDSENEILGALNSNHANRSLEDLQRNAWRKQIEILKKSLSGLSGKIYFEFAIPRMGKRVDNILVINDTIIVIEFKIGDKTHDKHAINQVLDYSLDLKNFHEGSHHIKLAPILVATNGENRSYNIDSVLELTESINTNEEHLRDTIESVVNFSNPPLNISNWENSIYKPTPTIVEAAQALYKGHNVNEISRSDSGAINLSKTTFCLSNIIDDAKTYGKKSICFITGVPGAGKTLAGLNIANERMKADEDEHAVFLSGNGPLVDVLREALARDLVLSSKSSRKPISKDSAKRRTNAFIQNIHHFRDEYLKQEIEPTEHVVVFDEAQRAWNQNQVSSFMKRKKGIENFNKSEPEFLIEVMDRHSDWCTIICLIGGGQEINTGEAGIEEWIHALKHRFTNWDVHYSDKIIDDINYLKSPDLSTWLQTNGSEAKNLHLSVSARSFRSEKISAFVHSLLELEKEECKSLYQEICPNFPILITRELNLAKKWLNKIRRGTERTGIIASSGARRLRPQGIDVKNSIEAPNWFLNPIDDIRSSYFLEDVATEFDIQGLEIDYTCLAWGANFHLKNNDWHFQKFKGTKWQNIKKNIDKEYLKNTYRVLLTRARQGMIIYIPKGDIEDKTRAPEFYNYTYEYLKEIGLKEITTD